MPKKNKENNQRLLVNQATLLAVSNMLKLIDELSNILKLIDKVLDEVVMLTALQQELYDDSKVEDNKDPDIKLNEGFFKGD